MLVLRLFIVIKNPAIGENLRNSVFSSKDSSSFQIIVRDSIFKGAPFFRNNTPDYVLLDWATFKEIWALYEGELESSAAREPGLIERALAYIDAHLSEHIEAEEIAAYCYVTRRHLGEVFRERMGMSVLAYVEEQRMEKAKKLLARPGMQIKEILRRCGFRSAAYFSNQFRKRFGVTPTEYRRQMMAGTDKEKNGDADQGPFTCPA